MKYFKQISVIIFLSIFFGILRYLLINVSEFNLIKTKRVLDKIEVNNMPEILTEPMQIDTRTAYFLYSEESAIFIDARDANEYNDSHIKGSISIPYDYYEDYEDRINNLNKMDMYVIYCSGGECSLSIDLADYLFYELEFENILIYENGFPDWMKNKYDIE